MKKFFYCLIICSLFLDVDAQDKMFNMTEAVYGNYTGLGAERLANLQWTKNPKQYSYTSDSSLIIENIDGEIVYELFIRDFNQLLIKEKLDSIKKFPPIKWMGELQFRFNKNNAIYRYDLVKNQLLKIKDIDFSDFTTYLENKEGQFAYIKDDDLYFEDKKLTSDGGNGIVYGQAVHRYEFGINQGLFWSESGKTLVFYRMDESMVSEYPLYNLNDTPATVKMIRYPTAGKASHHAKVGIYLPLKEKLFYLNTESNDPETYYTNIAISPDDNYITVAELNREQNYLKFQIYDAQTGHLIKTLFEEKNDKYVEPENPPYFLDNNNFLWQSERDGYNHLFLYSLENGLIQQITKGNWVLTELHGVDKDKKIYFSSTKESPLNRDLYCINIDGKGLKKLTKGSGTHQIMLNENQTYFIDQFSSTTVIGETKLVKNTGQHIRDLKISKNPLNDYLLGDMEILELKADDGTILYGRLFKPANFDKKKKYPVIVYLYNGPHIQLVRNTWLGSANLWYQYLAQRGYAVFTVDGRGSLNRGFDFESAVHRQLGTLEMKDQMTGVNYLKSLEWIDQERMGIQGWSYGGFMTISMMTRNPGIFKVGVAGGPVIDWKFYEIMYTERYMDSPKENPEGYNNNSLFQYVDNLKGKLMIIHGSQDDVVLWQHSMLYLQEAVKKNQQIDYYIYPNHKHNVGGMDRVHLMQKMTDYLMQYLE